ncbi:MAG: T9SS type A sorting domain-containing protein [Bacteroidales bacterium]|nr:T9SS type A sorting domain-containing protein [Bacteroidales bacterium]
MKRYLLLLLLICSTFVAYANEPLLHQGSISFEQQIGVRISVQGHTVRVQFAEGLLLEVYDLVGKKCAAYSIATNDESVVLQLPKGYYLLKVGKQVRKIAL